tara:strand:- start:2216 stop:2359 length:144 start_codon:yes stop_codon:yes gene_type:complete
MYLPVSAMRSTAELILPILVALDRSSYNFSGLRLDCEIASRKESDYL